MHVTKIHVTTPVHQQSPGVWTAIVSISGAFCAVRLRCEVPAVAAGNGAGRRALIREALRQLRRMPELRTGREGLSFAPGALPLGI